VATIKGTIFLSPVLTLALTIFFSSLIYHRDDQFLCLFFLNKPLKHSISIFLTKKIDKKNIKYEIYHFHFHFFFEEFIFFSFRYNKLSLSNTIEKVKVFISFSFNH
jgi:hypothetical protein